MPQVSCTHPRAKRSRFALAALGSVILLLSGCQRNDLTVKVSKTGAVTGTFIYARDKKAMASFKVTEAMMKKNIAKSLRVPLPKGVTDAIYNSGKWIGIKYTMKAMDKDAFMTFVGNVGNYAELDGTDDESDDSPGSNATLTQNAAGQWEIRIPFGDSTTTTTTTTAPPEAASTEVGVVNDAELGAAFDEGLRKTFTAFPPVISFKFTFPGKVVSADPLATVSGNSVSWTFGTNLLDIPPGTVLTAVAENG